MSGRVRRLPLRVRLVAGFLVAMLVVLTGAGTFVYWRVKFALDRDLDSELAQSVGTIEPLVGDDGTLSDPDQADATGAAWQVLSPTGLVLDAGGGARQEPLVDTNDFQSLDSDGRTVDLGRFLPAEGRPFRVRVLPVDDGAADLVVAVRRDHRDEALRELLAQLTLAGLGALGVTAIVGDLLARAALRPVERYRSAAAEIAAGAGGVRLDVPVEREDEITRLGHTLNQMLASLEEGMERERRFVDDASHELRTPLTLLKSRIQLARRRDRSTADLERVLDELEVDVTRLIDLAEQLLLLRGGGDSEGDADVGRVVRTVVERRRLARPEEAHLLVLDEAPDGVCAALDPRVLGRVLTNLVDNAFVHGRPPVRISVDVVDGWARVQVEDAGDGMPPDLLARATSRFLRSDEARGRPGAGLGLALVEQAVAGNGGQLRLCSAGEHARYGAPGGPSCDHSPAMTATVLLPRAPDAEPAETHP